MVTPMYQLTPWYIWTGGSSTPTREQSSGDLRLRILCQVSFKAFSRNEIPSVERPAKGPASRGIAGAGRRRFRQLPHVSALFRPRRNGSLFWREQCFADEGRGASTMTQKHGAWMASMLLQLHAPRRAAEARPCSEGELCLRLAASIPP